MFEEREKNVYLGPSPFGLLVLCIKHHIHFGI